MKVKNLIEVVIDRNSDELLFGREVVAILQNKIGRYPLLRKEINNAIRILQQSCYANLQKSKMYWNMIINNTDL